MNEDHDISFRVLRAKPNAKTSPPALEGASAWRTLRTVYSYDHLHRKEVNPLGDEKRLNDRAGELLRTSHNMARDLDRLGQRELYVSHDLDIRVTAMEDKLKAVSARRAPAGRAAACK